MKKILLGAAFALVATVAFAQVPEKEYTFVIPASEVNTIGKALDALPYKEAAPVIQKLLKQIAEQNEPPKAAEPEKK